MRFQDQVVIITGAGRGMGFAFAEAFGREGAQVIIGELVAERGLQAAEQLNAQGYKAQAIPLDVTKTDSCRALTEQVMAEHGHIDVLVNNAGLFILHKSEDMPEADWRIQIDVMLSGVFFMTQAVAKAAMIPQQRGNIVSVASIGGMGGWPMRSAYNAAKAGVISLTEVLASEWAHYGIRVNCISPGVTRTDMLNVAIKEGVATVDKYENRTPLGRLAETKEMADAVLFLASERAKHITGMNLRVDGGWVPWAAMFGAVGYPEEPANG
ncbi:MAG TPA: glucose 1-dehydrogenase [Anaerolineae bacterium]|nr:glucose 1-dehydrogenase [Anaerolineae bacterium]